MKPKVFFSLVILALIVHSCSSEKKIIRGVWIDQHVPNADIYYMFERNGTYTHLNYGPASPKGTGEWVFRDGSIGYYKYIGNREFNLYQIDIDLLFVVQ